ncbi:hypothetical protein B0H11DRAFT_2261412 [Mycena galericulata]|nr:hypothetical protein B0H11DRAFT_2261412 [Mycena galericulata]
MNGRREYALGEDPHDVPLITFLREQSESVSCTSSVSVRGSSPYLGSRRADSGATFVDAREVRPCTNAAGAAPPPRVNASTTAPFPFKPVPSFPLSSSTPPPSARELLPAPRLEPPAARTRAETGASAHDAPPRYTYTVTHVGKLPGESVVGSPVAMLVERLRAREYAEAEMGMKVDEPSSRTWMEPRENTAPTAGYVARLEEHFGAGSALREEGPKPAVDLLRRRGGGRGRSANTGTGRSTSSSGLMDVDGDAEGSRSACGGRAQMDPGDRGARPRKKADDAGGQAISPSDPIHPTNKHEPPQDMNSLAQTVPRSALDGAEGCAGFCVGFCVRVARAASSEPSALKPPCPTIVVYSPLPRGSNSSSSPSGERHAPLWRIVSGTGLPAAWRVLKRLQAKNRMRPVRGSVLPRARWVR